MDSCKYKLGIKRDSEPFIYSDELNYFLTNFANIRVDEDAVGSITKIKNKEEKMEESVKYERNPQGGLDQVLD